VTERDGPAPGRLARLWGEVRARRLVPTALIYCGGAFGLMQALDITFNRYQVPQVWFDVAAIFLLCGIPGSLLIAWFHGEPGAQAIQRKELALQALLLLVALFFCQRAWRANAGEQEHASLAVRSIVVLPFRNLSENRADEYFSEGVAEDVLTRLSRVADLRVASRTTSLRYRGTTKTARQIAGEIGVDHVLEGSVRKDGSRVRVTARLIGARTDEELWSETYDREMKDLFDLQSELAETIVKRLEVRLSLAERARLGSRPTQDLEAYQSLLRGRYFVDRFTPDGLAEGIRHYQAALDRDPLLAEAYAGLALAYGLSGLYFSPAVEKMPLAKAYAERALSLDPDLAGPRWVLGVVALLYDWDFETARRNLVDGDRVRPEALPGFGCLGHLLQALGRAQDAEASLKRALAEDPVSVSLNTELGCNCYYARRFPEAVVRYRSALQLDPRNFLAIYGLGRAYAQERDYARAIEILGEAERGGGPVPPLVLSELGYAYARAGQRSQARAVVGRLEAVRAHAYVDPYLTAVVFLGLGDARETFAWLDRAFGDRSGFLVSLPSDPRWDSLRDDARFKALLARMGI
jgi:TolB-like protein